MRSAGYVNWVSAYRTLYTGQKNAFRSHISSGGNHADIGGHASHHEVPSSQAFPTQLRWIRAANASGRIFGNSGTITV